MTLIRSILYLIFFATTSLVLYTAAIPLFLAPRKAVVRASQFWVRVSLWGLRVLCGQSFEVRGREHIPKSAGLIAAKHFSMWETLAFFILVDDPAFVLKRELLWVPLYGWYAQKMKMIPVDRSGKASALRAMRRASKAALEAKRQIVIFPEGTRRKPGDPPAYRPGIASLYAHLGVPCVPVALNTGNFWAEDGITKKPGKIIVEFLPAIAPGLKRDAFMAELETRIEAATNELLEETGQKAE